jgi:chromosome segregation ATPase
MTQQASQTRSPERLAPLLRSIQHEITERLERMSALEERLGAFEATRRIHAEEVATLESELSTHRRELRRIEKELSRLGVRFDAENARAFVGSLAAVRGGRHLEDTGFRPRMVDARA